MRAIVVFAFAAALLVGAFVPGPVDAKGPPTYTLTGGDLGEQALPFSAPGGYLLQGTNAQQIDRPPASPGVAYDIYASAAYTYGSRRPDFRYYPEAGLLYATREGPGRGQSWYRPDDATAAFLERTLADARSRMAAGQLARNPVEAAFRAGRMDALSYTVRREPIAGGAPLWLDAVESYCPCPVPSELVPDLIMAEVVDILSHAPKGVAIARDVVLISQDNAQGYGALGCYKPPADGQPGLFWFRCAGNWEGGIPYYHETTARFDDLVREAIETRREAAPAHPIAALPPTEPAPVAGTAGSVAGLGAAFVAVAGLWLARRLWPTPMS